MAIVNVQGVSTVGGGGPGADHQRVACGVCGPESYVYVAYALSIYVGLGIPAILGTLYVLGKALDFYERIEARRVRRGDAR